MLISTQRLDSYREEICETEEYDIMLIEKITFPMILLAMTPLHPQIQS